MKTVFTFRKINYALLLTAALFIISNFSSQVHAQYWTLNGADILNNNSGNVQIGSTTSYANFDPNGNLRMIGNSTYLVGANRYAFRFPGGPQGIFLNAATPSIDIRGNGGATIFSANTVNGNADIAGDLRIAGDYLVPGSSYAFRYDGPGDFGLYFDDVTGAYQFLNGSGAPAVSFHSGGMGTFLSGITIGNASPGSSGAGTIRFDGTVFEGYDGTAWVGFSDSDDDWSGAGTGQMYVTRDNDFVGIGTATPAARLTVRQNAETDDQGIWIRSSWGPEVAKLWMHGATFRINRGIDTTHGISINNDGNVGIGTIMPQCALHVLGNNNLAQVLIAPRQLQGSGNAQLLLAEDEVGNVGFTLRYDGFSNKTYFIEKVGSTDNTIMTLDHLGGSVGIGTSYIPNNHKLAVEGKILCEELEVALRGDWPDYVFADGYELMPIPELAKHLKKEKHLPGFPSAKEMGNTLSVGETQRLMMEKIEELTLYVVQQDEKISEMNTLLVQLSEIGKEVSDGCR